MKKIFLFLALCAAVCVSAADSFYDGGLYYEVDPTYTDPAVYVIGQAGSNSTVAIPAYVTGNGGIKYMVLGVKEEAFKNNTHIKNLTFDKMEYCDIQKNAFLNCTKLETIDCIISDKCYGSRIGDRAFSGCTALKTVVLPTELIYSGEWIFGECTSLEKVTFNKTYEMWWSAFRDCTALKTVVWNNPNPNTLINSPFGGRQNWNYSDGAGGYSPLPKNQITKVYLQCDLPESIFKSEGNLETVMISSNVKSIGKSAFLGCTKLATITGLMYLESIGASAFAACPLNAGTKGLILNASYIGARAFEEGKYTAVQINSMDASKPADIQGIAFSSDEMKEITIQGYIKNIGGQAFAGEKIEKVTLNILNDYTQDYPADYEQPFKFVTNVSTVVCEGGNWKIGKHMFANMSSIEYVLLDVADVDATAFAQCSNISVVHWKVSNGSDYTSDSNPFKNAKLRTVYVKSSVPAHLFDGQSTISYAEMSDGVTIGAYAFANCGFASLTLPATVARIETGAFANSKIKSINLDKVRYIGPSAFLMTPITTAKLTGLTKAIGEAAFQDCAALASVTLPSYPDQINRSVFSGCSSLKKISLPSNIKTIGDEAFLKTGLTSIILPSSVQTIGDRAFGTIASLQSVTVNGSPIPQITELSFRNSDNVAEIKANCNNIESLKANAKWLAVVGNNPDKIKLSDIVISDWQSYLNYDDAYNYKTAVVALQEPTCDDKLVLQATPESGASFVEWADGNTDNPRTIELYNWTFSGPFFAVSAEASDYLSLSINADPADGATFRILDVNGNAVDASHLLPITLANPITIEPLIEAGYEFVNWNYTASDDVSEDPETHVLTVDFGYTEWSEEDPETHIWTDKSGYKAPLNYTLKLKAPVYIYTKANNPDWGKTGAYINADGQWIIWASSDDPHYQFIGWDDNADGNVDSEENYREVPAETHSYTAIFQQVELKFNVYIVERGSGTVLEYRRVGGGSLINIPEGESVSIEAVCNSETKVVGWEVDGVSIGTTNPILLTESITTDYFVICDIEWTDPYTNSYIVNVNYDPTMGNVFVNNTGFTSEEPGMLMGYAKPGTKLVFTAEALDNYAFSSWNVMIGNEKTMSEENPFVLTVPALPEGGDPMNIIMIEAAFEYSQGEGIEAVPFAKKAQKMLIDGNIYIIRENKVYTITGMRVR